MGCTACGHVTGLDDVDHQTLDLAALRPFQFRQVGALDNASLRADGFSRVRIVNFPDDVSMRGGRWRPVEQSAAFVLR